MRISERGLPVASSMVFHKPTGLLSAYARDEKTDKKQTINNTCDFLTMIILTPNQLQIKQVSNRYKLKPYYCQTRQLEQ